jgi:hypothetical protein
MMTAEPTIPAAPKPITAPQLSSATQAMQLLNVALLWLQKNDPERLQAWMRQPPIGRVLSKGEQGEGYDPQMAVIHFPGGHPPEGTNLYAAPQASNEALQVLTALRAEMHAALQAGKLTADAISPGLVKRWADVLDR